MARKMIDCRTMPSEIGCTLTIAGEEDEVLDAAVAHAIAKHGHADTPELREQIRAGWSTPNPRWPDRGNATPVSSRPGSRRQRPHR